MPTLFIPSRGTSARDRIGSCEFIGSIQNGDGGTSFSAAPQMARRCGWAIDVRRFRRMVLGKGKAPGMKSRYILWEVRPMLLWVAGSDFGPHPPSKNLGHRHRPIGPLIILKNRQDRPAGGHCGAVG